MIVKKKLSGRKAIFSLLFMLGFTHCKEPIAQQPLIRALAVEFKQINSADDIKDIQDSLVVPVIYNEVISLDDLPVDIKKKKFIDMMLPAVLYVKYNFEQLSNRIDELIYIMESSDIMTPDDSVFLEENLLAYRANDIFELREKLVTHPVSIVLAQAAIESGWGTSRFFLEANNVFGIWSYNPREERIQSRFGRDGQNIYLRKYEHLSESIEDYFNTVARSKAYSSFRKIRAATDDVYEMADYLNRYSELGYEYVAKLKYVIRTNNLTQYDNYQLDPSYFVDTFDGTLLVSR
jgi:Bax protein